jgi:RND family efflux transporter MFP subunit
MSGLIYMFGVIGVNSQAAGPETAQAVLTATTVTPVVTDWPRTLRVNGGIYPWQEAIVASEIGGLALVVLPVDVGSRVKRGQELARLSDATLRASMAQQQASVARAMARLDLARANHKRAQAVQGSGALAEYQITQYALEMAVAEADLAAAQATLELETVRLRQTRILAADDGTISSRTATLGAVVQTGSELFRLIRQQRLEWRAELTASQLQRLHGTETARILLDSSTPDAPTLVATQRQIAPALDPARRTGLVYFDLPPDSPAKAGMFVQGEIHLGDTPAITLPQSALVTSDGFTYVFLRHPEHGDQVTRRKVTTGRRQGERVEILDGIAADAAVVKSGGAFLRDGDRVRWTGAAQ